MPRPALQRRPLGSISQQQRQQRVAEPAPPAARPRDPDAIDGGEEEEEGNKGPPTLLWRVLAAMFYLVPWIDCMRWVQQPAAVLHLVYWSEEQSLDCCSFCHLTRIQNCLNTPCPVLLSSLGREMYRKFRNLLVLYLIPGVLCC